MQYCLYQYIVHSLIHVLHIITPSKNFPSENCENWYPRIKVILQYIICCGASKFLLLSNINAGFLSLLGKWHILQHVAPLLFPVWFPYYGMTSPASSIQPPWQTIRLLSGQSVLARVMNTIYSPSTSNLALLRSYFVILPDPQGAIILIDKSVSIINVGQIFLIFFKECF